MAGHQGNPEMQLGMGANQENGGSSWFTVRELPRTGLNLPQFANRFGFRQVHDAVSLQNPIKVARYFWFSSW